MRPEDLAFAAECPVLEGWTGDTPEVIEGFFAHDPDGCFVAEAAGRPAGICVATPYGAAGFIGWVIVRREARGRGLGPVLLDAAIRYLKDRGIENICLDGVEKAVPYYALSGFRPVSRSLRFGGRVDEISQTGWPIGSGNVRPMRERDLPSVLEMDRLAFGADRGFFLNRRYSLHRDYAWVAEEDGRMAGFIMGHDGDGTAVAGPWIADERCRYPGDLLGPFLARAKGKRFRVGVLEMNESAVRYLRAVPGLVEQPPSIRMVLGPSDRLGNSPMCWAVGSPAKG